MTRDDIAPAPSIHLRALVTWATIFPLVTLGMTLLGPLLGPRPIWFRALVLTLVVVPLAVYLVVPALLRVVTRLRRDRRSCAAPSQVSVSPR